MNTDDILNAIDAQIARLQRARNALAGLSSPKRRGRPPAPSAAKKRTLSPAVRRRIADAQRKRWAAQKAAAKKAAKKMVARKVAVTKIPPRQQRKRTPRAAKKAVVKNALSNKSETVAVPKKNEERS